MQNRKVRNEFGLDEQNALDVQKERITGSIPWVWGALAAFALFAVMFAANKKAL